MSRLSQPLLYRDLRNFLERPELRLSDVGRRRNVLDDAFKHSVPAALTRIDLSGQTHDFVIHLITQLDDFGFVDGLHCLERFLHSLADGEGEEIVQQCAKLSSRIHDEIVQNENVQYLSLAKEVKQMSQGLPTFLPTDLLNYHFVHPPIADHVWHAVETAGLKRQVAIKRLDARLLDVGFDVLGRRIQDLQYLDHPHLVPIYNWDRERFTYIILRWIDGKPLTEIVRKPLAPGRVINWMMQITDALSYAHNLGILHGNIKPSNIFIDNRADHLYLTDFGLIPGIGLYDGDQAYRKSEASSPNEYLAPEQQQGQHCTAASDQYALGLIVREMLTGKPSVGNTREGSSDLKRQNESSRPLDIPETVNAVISKACALHPADRFRSTLAFADALSSAIQYNSFPDQRREAEQQYLATLVAESSEATRHYVGLRGLSRGSERRSSSLREKTTGAGRATAGVRHPVLYQPTAIDGRAVGEPTEDIRKSLIEISKVVLLGDPGSGKTSTILQVVLELAKEAQLDASQRIPVIVPLNLFDGTTSFEDFIREQMPGIGYQLEVYLRNDRVLLIFDALNETSEHLKVQIVNYLERLDRFIVTCRIRDYREELSRISNLGNITILDFDPPRIKKAMKHLLGSKGDELWQSLGGNIYVLSLWRKLVKYHQDNLFWSSGRMPDYTSADEDSAYHQMHQKALLPLCRNPFMLNLMCSLYQREGQLPANRADVFNQFSTSLLRSEIDRVASASGLTNDIEKKPRRESVIRTALSIIASAIQERQLGAGIWKSNAEELLVEKIGLDECVFALNIAIDCNLLCESAGHLFFSHQLIQEYFAAEAIAKEFNRDHASSASMFFNQTCWWEPQGWEESAILFIGLCENNKRDQAIQWVARAQPEVAIRCITESGIAGEGLQGLTNELRIWFQNYCTERLLHSKEPEMGRAAISRSLGRIGDMRSGTGCNSDGVPEVVWRELTEFGYSISIYPITVCQYAAFIADRQHGYFTNGCWSEEGLEWIRKSGEPQETYVTIANHPRTNVNWYEAEAFCRWLSYILNKEITLPTENEWIFATRGSSQMPFAWGDVYHLGAANVRTEENIRSQLTAVGIYPQSDSPFGVKDLHGNVWEWCRDVFPVTVNGNNPHSFREGVRILHGGSWKRPPEFSKCDYRYWCHPSFRDNDIGFRVVSRGTKVFG